MSGRDSLLIMSGAFVPAMLEREQSTTSSARPYSHPAPIKNVFFHDKRAQSVRHDDEDDTFVISDFLSHIPSPPPRYESSGKPEV